MKAATKIVLLFLLLLGVTEDVRPQYERDETITTIDETVYQTAKVEKFIFCHNNYQSSWQKMLRR